MTKFYLTKDTRAEAYLGARSQYKRVRHATDVSESKTQTSNAARAHAQRQKRRRARANEQ